MSQVNGATLKLYDGEVGSAPLLGISCAGYAQEVSGQGLSNSKALKIAPDAWHISYYRLFCADAPRRDFSPYSYLSFYIRATDSNSKDKKFWLDTWGSGPYQRSNLINMTKYLVEGGTINTNWKEVRIPIADLANADWRILNNVEALNWEEDASGKIYYVDNISLLTSISEQTPNPICGDGSKSTNEQCDDANNINGDGCSATCQIEQTPQTPNIPSETTSSFALQVNAGIGQSITLPQNTVLLTGSIASDKPVTLQWSKIKGPGTVTFSSPFALSTPAAFSKAGVYVLRLAASSSSSSKYDEVTIVVNSQSSAENFPRASEVQAFTVNIEATVEKSPPRITLSWTPDAASQKYEIYRKLKNDRSWSNLGSTTSNTYQDMSVQTGIIYEYMVKKVRKDNYIGYGFLYTGIEVPFPDSRGKIILIIDNTYSNSLASEISRLEQDLVGDGWQVIKHEVSRNEKAFNIKKLIVNDYNADSYNVKAVFLLGHVPVPYSGNIAPDGHGEHLGAWPADAYYGDINGVWAGSVSTFSPSLLPSPVDLMVGRADFADMPGSSVSASFPTELELLRNYLNKDHAFRQKKMIVEQRAIISDQMGVIYGHPHGVNAWRNFVPLVGTSKVYNVAVSTYASITHDQSYLLGLANGAGSYNSVARAGTSGNWQEMTSADIINQDSGAVFNLALGSWFGDWDSQDNLLRAFLANSKGLASAWAGRPDWFIQHLGLGEPIGYSARASQNSNSSGPYYQSAANADPYEFSGLIHSALMGDPTLRLKYIAPPPILNATKITNGVSLAWQSSQESSVSYYVYRANSLHGTFSRITASPVTSTTFTDPAGSSSSVYMVRAIKLETTPSGSYYNPSQGVFSQVSTSSTTPSTPITPPVNPPLNNSNNSQIQTPQNNTAPVSGNASNTSVNNSTSNNFLNVTINQTTSNPQSNQSQNTSSEANLTYQENSKRRSRGPIEVESFGEITSDSLAESSKNLYEESFADPNYSNLDQSQEETQKINAQSNEKGKETSPDSLTWILGLLTLLCLIIAIIFYTLAHRRKLAQKRDTLPRF